MTIESVSVIGLGYIGLPTAAVIAARKVRVVGVDINESTVATINRGEIHIHEPDLDILVRAVVTDGLLRATQAAEPADAFLIAVPTPFRDDYQPDLGFIEAAAAQIAPVLKRGDVVILESTSPVGATESLAAWLAAHRPDLSFPQDKGEDSDIRVAHCPERVLPGKVLRELVANDRVIGGMTPRCAEAARKLYTLFVDGECVLTDVRTAELCKLVENSFRDVNIAFANELSLVCARLGIDVWELIRLANRHPRVNILQPGPGVGGHCIAVDPWFIVSQAPEEAKLIATARSVNDGKPMWVVAEVQRALISLAKAKGLAPARLTLACFGLSFKADIDDLRESPAVEITARLAEQHPGATFAVEPHIDTLPGRLMNAQVQLVSLDQALEAADVAVLLVDHLAFKSIDLSRLAGKAIIDTRGVWPVPATPSSVTQAEARLG